MLSPRGARRGEVKEAIIAACNRYGRNGKGEDGLEGYMLKLCEEFPSVMGGLLRAIMPTQVTIHSRSATGSPPQALYG